VKFPNKFISDKSFVSGILSSFILVLFNFKWIVLFSLSIYIHKLFHPSSNSPNKIFDFSFNVKFKYFCSNEIINNLSSFIFFAEKIVLICLKCNALKEKTIVKYFDKSIWGNFIKKPFPGIIEK
jgi:hypothetical protein